MPLGDLAGEAVGGVVRFVGRVLFEIVFEVMIHGTGYAVIKVFRPQSEPSDKSCAIVGLAIWAGAAGLGFWFYRYAAHS